MEEEQTVNALASAFPNPPPFWQSFTPENLDRIAELRAKEEGSKGKKPDPAKDLPVRLLDLPAELRLLQPPSLPKEGAYRVFGDVYFLNEPLRSLEDQGIQQLYTPPSTPNQNGKHNDRAIILKRIAKSLLLNFLELVGVMSINPAQHEEKTEDLRTLFINFHHLLNEYRPHQARESLILMMQEQLEKSRKETEGIRDMKRKVEAILEGLGQAKLAEIREGDDKAEGDAFEEERDVWEELEKNFG